MDNDGDSLIDAGDPGCVDALDTDEADIVVPNCNDGIDNDGDGWVDADDPDCMFGLSEVGFGTTECNDGVDNDGDSLIDASDPGCVDALDNDEAI